MTRAGAIYGRSRRVPKHITEALNVGALGSGAYGGGLPCYAAQRSHCRAKEPALTLSIFCEVRSTYTCTSKGKAQFGGVLNPKPYTLNSQPYST